MRDRITVGLIMAAIVFFIACPHLTLMYLLIDARLHPGVTLAGIAALLAHLGGFLAAIQGAKNLGRREGAPSQYDSFREFLKESPK